MNVILCHPGDGAALALARAWRRRGTAVDLVTVEQLVYSRRIVWQQDADGDRGEVVLHDGRRLRPEAIDLLINRIRWLPTDHFARAGATDREYAAAELSAFLLAWLNGIAGRVLNPPRPYALGGAEPGVMALHHYAALAGLPLDDRCFDDHEASDAPMAAERRAIVFDGRVYGAALPRTWHQPLAQLASLLGLPLMQAEFARTPGQDWQIVAAHGLVDFAAGGAALLRALDGVAREAAA